MAFSLAQTAATGDRKSLGLRTNENMSTAARRSHRGDEYQIVVASHWVAQLLLNDAIDSVRISAIGAEGKG